MPTWHIASRARRNVTGAVPGGLAGRRCASRAAQKQHIPSTYLNEMAHNRMLVGDRETQRAAPARPQSGRAPEQRGMQQAACAAGWLSKIGPEAPACLLMRAHQCLVCVHPRPHRRAHLRWHRQRLVWYEEQTKRSAERARSRDLVDHRRGRSGRRAAMAGGRRRARRPPARAAAAPPPRGTGHRRCWVCHVMRPAAWMR
jgi:hypothetical protein